MQAIDLIGDIDEQHYLQARVPEGLPAGPVRLIVLLPDEDSGGLAWADGPEPTPKKIPSMRR
jgi:hypothetical protein